MTMTPKVAPPNFFIVGAPKCGTTSLARYLSQHPQVFLPDLKEPHFFNSDIAHHNVQSERDYLQLFADVTNERAIGESSVLYLFSRTAIPNIVRFNPSARIIVMLRDPVEMVESRYAQLCFAGVENAPDLETAWAKQAVRANGSELPPRCGDPIRLQYGKVAKVGEQLERLLQVCDRNSVHVVFLDDLKTAPHDAYKGTLRFLGVSTTFEYPYPVLNARKEHRSRVAARALRSTARAAHHLGIEGTGLLAPLDRLNQRPWRRPVPSDHFRRYLRSYFAEDIALVSRLVERDLDHWLPA